MKSFKLIVITFSLILGSNISFPNLIEESQTYYSVDDSNYCIEAEDIVFEYTFSLDLNPNLANSPLDGYWLENVTFPDCDLSILARWHDDNLGDYYTDSPLMGGHWDDYSNILHVRLDHVGYLNLSDVFNILNLNLSESRFLDYELDPDCINNLELSSELYSDLGLNCEIINIEINGRGYLFSQSELEIFAPTTISDSFVTPSMHIDMELNNYAARTYDFTIKSFQRWFCDENSDGVLFPILAKNLSKVPITCDGKDFIMYDFSSLLENPMSIAGNSSLSDFSLFAVSNLLNSNYYSDYLIYANIEKSQPYRCDNEQDNDWSYDIKLYRIPVNIDPTSENWLSTIENYASLVDICVTDGGDVPAIKLSSDEKMAYIYSESGSSDHLPISWDIETNLTYDLPITNHYIKTSTFDWIYGTHDLIGFDLALVVINSTNSDPAGTGYSTLLNGEELNSNFAPDNTPSNLRVHSPYFHVGTHEMLGSNSVIIAGNDCLGRWTLSQLNLSTSSTGSYTINSNRTLHSGLNRDCYDEPKINPHYLMIDEESAGTVTADGYEFTVESDELIITGRFLDFHNDCSFLDWDEDQDTIPNMFDDDDDGDGIPDSNESILPNDRDRDGIRDRCDFDEVYLPEGSPIYWNGADADRDNDIVADGNDKCPDGVSNWWTNLDHENRFQKDSGAWVQGSLFDYDNDGCHDLLEDEDDDNDGVNDTDDDCPQQVGFFDYDSDGLCELIDEDLDNDGWSNEDEDKCVPEEIRDSWDFGDDDDADGILDYYFIHKMNSSSTPADQDNDTVCDKYDEDKDNDGIYDDWFDWHEDQLPIGYVMDAFPLDHTEWSDLDSDGFGDNSDDCIGTFGTSYIDRLGCLDQDSDGYSDLNDKYPYDPDRYQDGGASSFSEIDWLTISLLLFLSIVSFLVVRKLRNISFRNDDEDDDESEDYNEFYSSETQNSDPIENNDWPSNSINGTFDEDGYEWCEYPENSDIWFWRDEVNGDWEPYNG